VEQRFTVHRVPVSAFHRPEFSPADIAAIRDNIGASQAVFAALLGTSANTVRAWEQGINPPSGIAARFLDEIRRTPDYWRNRIAEAAG
jgi:putative transcriptional regulator